MILNNYRQYKAANLKFIQISGDRSTEHIFLLHGYGANPFDLAPLSKEIHLNNLPKPNWYFPQAPCEIELGMGYTGRAWFPIDRDLLEKPPLRYYSQKIPRGLKEARDSMIDLFQALELKPSQIILGGFSQGAMLAVDIAVHTKEAFKALIIFSGTLVNGKEWIQLAEKHEGIKFFQAHGQNDPLLSIDDARQLHQLLTNAKFDGTFVEFAGGHEIPAEVISQLNEFLSDIK